jgi:hypothetical protein
MVPKLVMISAAQQLSFRIRITHNALAVARIDKLKSDKCQTFLKKRKEIKNQSFVFVFFHPYAQERKELNASCPLCLGVYLFAALSRREKGVRKR